MRKELAGLVCVVTLCGCGVVGNETGIADGNQGIDSTELAALSAADVSLELGFPFDITNEPHWITRAYCPVYDPRNNDSCMSHQYYSYETTGLGNDDRFALDFARGVSAVAFWRWLTEM